MTFPVRTVVLFIALSSIAACSCQRQADASRETAPDSTTVRPHPQQAGAAATPASDTALPDNATQPQAASILHAYLHAVTAKKWSEADTYWTAGKAPVQPGDESVRAIQDLRALRIRNEPPGSLDDESPPRAIEIPVTLRIQKDSGVTEISGWYRMRRKVGGDGWEITSASMRTSLD